MLTRSPAEMANDDVDKWIKDTDKWFEEEIRPKLPFVAPSDTSSSGAISETPAAPTTPPPKAVEASTPAPVQRVYFYHSHCCSNNLTSPFFLSPWQDASVGAKIDVQLNEVDKWFLSTRVGKWLHDFHNKGDNDKNP